MKINTGTTRIIAVILAVGLLLASGAMAADQSVTGTIIENDSGNIIISADDGEDYLVQGKDLSEMLGKTVRVTGTLAEQEGAKSITVMKLEEIQD